MSNMVSLTAIEAIGKYLARAVKNGNDLEAREQVAFANTMSGYAMLVGCCTSEHSMEHAMSAYHQDLLHGTGLIMISKAYYEYFINAHACDDPFIRMAQALGLKEAKEPMDFSQGNYKIAGGLLRSSIQAMWFMILPNIKHWHGAARDSWFVHISIETTVQAGPAEWLEGCQ